jgi:acetyl-CoA carboxylase biotin carboxyl carrier protein
MPAAGAGLPAAAADPAVVPPAAVAAPAQPPAADEDDGLVVIASPIVGTFYESSSPGSAAFVQVGDRVEAGQTLCIIEAMKLMNEIEAEVGGVVVKRFAKNTQPVEYGEPLFGIRPN